MQPTPHTPCEFTKVAVLARLKVNRGSSTPVVKSRFSVEPSPRLFIVNMLLTRPRDIGRWKRPRRLRMGVPADQRNEWKAFNVPLLDLHWIVM